LEGIAAMTGKERIKKAFANTALEYGGY